MNSPYNSITSATDREWMLQALQEAQLAYAADEVPIGCVITENEQLISHSHNQTLALTDPCAHAEILALTLAAKKLGNHRLIHCEVFVTLEPCIMCIGAMIQARIKRLVFAADDPKKGILSQQDLREIFPQLNHYFRVESGLLQDPSQHLLKNFFQGKRTS
ncbi:MAG TPA: nucleoside deaminase [Gammaproteobacteria bacterium]|nr:nucleoside deaminase [Gammaproteobacteria bacterium]